MKRKILLTNKQKILCNKMFKETKETGWPVLVFRVIFSCYERQKEFYV
jgi:hypothetical protein